MGKSHLHGVLEPFVVGLMFLNASKGWGWGWGWVNYRL